MKQNNKTTKRSPWAWIPTVYLAEGLPYFAVNTLTVMLYTRMGVPVGKMAFFTGLLYLPWVIKPFWSPFVDVIRTKRWWTLTMQLLISITMIIVTLSITTQWYFAITIIAFWLMAFFSATHDIAADGYYMLALTEHQQAAYVGVRSTFYRIASVIGQGGLVMMAGWLEQTYGNIPKAWCYTFAALSILFLCITIVDRFAMPKVREDASNRDNSTKDILLNLVDSVFSFFTKKGIIFALLFMLLYRLPEAFMIKLVSPFMLGSHQEGGLAMTTAEVGLVNGTVGVVALLLGGIIGGLCIAYGGLKKWLWPMALSLTLPCCFYCFLAMYQPQNLWIIGSAVAVEQFGYGFGFTAFMLYLIYFSETKGKSIFKTKKEYKTSHYAFCTGFMALGMMLPGMVAGWLFEYFDKYQFIGSSSHQGYIIFFWFVMLCCIPTFIVCTLIKIDPQFGRKRK